MAPVPRRVDATISPPAAAVGDDALFGPGGDVPVQLVESDDLRSLHVALLDAFGSAVPVEPLVSSYNGSGYRPHVTVVDDRRLERGTAVELDTLLLVGIVVWAK